jgi:ABC-type dipeptide/oligopeptide/nickel transport system ATPase component
MMLDQEIALEVIALGVSYDTGVETSRVVDDVSFALKAGQTLAVVGESGSGKSSLAMAIAGLLPPSATVNGQVKLNGIDLLHQNARWLEDTRGNVVSVIFQNPMTSLNPTMRVGDQIAEQLLRHRPMTRKAAKLRAVELLEEVMIARPQLLQRRYPHELSGGMKQRVMIAMAVSCEPDILIADEPTTALDVTVQAEILQILRSLSKKNKMGLLLVTHDMGVVAQMATDVAVVYGGKFVEYAPVANLFSSPLHPYTQGLLKSQPRLNDREARHRRLPIIPPQAPMLSSPVAGFDVLPATGAGPAIPGQATGTRFIRINNELKAVTSGGASQ